MATQLPETFTKADVPFLAGVIALALGLMFYQTSHKPSQKITIQIVTPFEKTTYPLPNSGNKQKITVKGAIGESTIELSSAGARFIESACPNHTCISLGIVSHSHSSAACVPNKVIVTAKESGSGAPGEPVIDAITQ